MRVSRRHFLGLASIVTLKSFASGSRVFASNPLRIFEIKVLSDAGRRTEAYHLSDVFGDLTRGLVLQHHHLQAEYSLPFDGGIALKVMDTTSGQILETQIQKPHGSGTDDAHYLYAQALRLAIQLAPDEVYLVRGLCDYYTAFRKYDEGIACFEALIDLHPQQAQLSFQLGILSDRAGQKQKAYDAFRQANRLDTNDPVSMYNIGVVSTDLGRVNEAEHWFLETLSRDPGMKAARARLDRLRRRQQSGAGLAFKLDIL